MRAITIDAILPGMPSISLIKDVLAIVDGDDASLPAVDQAVAFASLHDACLTILVASENISLAAAAEPYGYALALTAAEELGARHLSAVRNRVKDCALDVTVQGLLDDPALLPKAARGESRYADVVLVPGVGCWRDDALRRHIAEAALFTGTPVILLPVRWSPAAFKHLALGWNASLESFRASRALLTLTEPGAQVDVLVVDQLDHYQAGAPVPGSHIARHLVRHGLCVDVHAIHSGHDSVADALQRFAAERGADALIVGGYGRSRALEFVLGGVTRDLFQHPRMPVVLAH